MKQIGLMGIVLLNIMLSAKAAESNPINPYVYVRFQNDDNLFRLKDETEALFTIGSADLEETVRQLGVGIEVDIPLSRQRVQANAVVYNADYTRFDSLDHVGSDISSVVNWEMGNLLSGDLGVKYSRQLSRFYELQAVLKDIRTRKTVFFSGGYRFHPSYRVVANLSLLDLGQKERLELDRDESTQAIELQYASSANTQVGTRIRHTKGDYVQTQIVAGNEFNNDFDENEYSAVLYWEGSEKSRFEARLGFTQRDHTTAQDRDFNGSTGRLKHEWRISTKTQIDSVMWREATTRDELTTFVTAKGLSISPVWSATRKVQVNASIEYETRDFEGIPELLLSANGVREDNVRSAGVTLNYKPTNNITLSFSYDKEQRNSNVEQVEFRSTVLAARGQVNF